MEKPNRNRIALTAFMVIIILIKNSRKEKKASVKNYNAVKCLVCKKFMQLFCINSLYE